MSNTTHFYGIEFSTSTLAELESAVSHFDTAGAIKRQPVTRHGQNSAIFSSVVYCFAGDAPSHEINRLMRFYKGRVKAYNLPTISVMLKTIYKGEIK